MTIPDEKKKLTLQNDKLINIISNKVYSYRL